MSKIAGTGLFFSFMGVLVWLSVVMQTPETALVSMDEPLPANSPIKTQEEIVDEMMPTDSKVDIVVAEGTKEPFILREAIPDPVRASDMPLPPPAEITPPTSITVIVVPEPPVEPVDPETTEPPIVTTEPPVEPEPTTDEPVPTTDSPVVTTEPTTTTEEPTTTTVEPTTTTDLTTTTEDHDPHCEVGLVLDPILGLCILP